MSRVFTPYGVEAGTAAISETLLAESGLARRIVRIEADIGDRLTT